MTGNSEDTGLIGDLALTRRALLRGGVLVSAGLAAAALIGCGGDDDEGDQASQQPSGGGATAQQKVGNVVPVPGDRAIAAGLPAPFNFVEPDKPKKKGGTIRWLYTFDPGQLDPTKTAAGGTQTAVNLVYDRLINVYGGPDADPFKINRLEPGLAKSWETSPDAKTYTFKLQQGVKFQNIAPVNGREFTSADAKFSYERYAADGAHRSLFENMESITAPDSSTLVIRLKRPSADFHLPLSSPYTTIHPREIVDDGSIAKVAIGTGPMIVKKWESGTGGSFVKNPTYWEREILLDGMELPYIADNAARTAATRAKQVDFGHAVSNVQELQEITASNPDLQVFTSPLFNSTFSIAFNNANPKWADDRIRQAIALSVNRDTVEQLVFGKTGKTLPTMDWRHAGLADEPKKGAPELGKWWRHDIAEAKRLLAAAGAENFAFEMVFYNYGDDSNARPNEILVDQLRQSGIKMTATKLEYTQFNSQWTTRKIQDAADGWLSFGSEPGHWVYGMHHSKSSGNRWNINDPQIDQWAEQHQTELNPQARTELARKVWDRLLDKVYRVEKPGGHAFQLYQPWVRGIRYSRLIGSGQFYLDSGNFARWGWLDK